MRFEHQVGLWDHDDHDYFVGVHVEHDPVYGPVYDHLVDTGHRTEPRDDRILEDGHRRRQKGHCADRIRKTDP